MAVLILQIDLLGHPNITKIGRPIKFCGVAYGINKPRTKSTLAKFISSDCVTGFPVLFMYFSRHLVPEFKSHDFFECACNAKRQQTL